MTIDVAPELVRTFAGNGSTTAFSYPVRFIDASDLVVILRSSDGVDTVQAITTHYTVSAGPYTSGATVTFVSAPASGQTVVIYRAVAAKQVVDLETYARNDAASVEAQLDRLAMVDQDLSSEVSRAVKVPPGHTPFLFDATGADAGDILIFRDDSSIGAASVTGINASAAAAAEDVINTLIPELTEDLASDPDFAALVASSVPTSLNASTLSSGTVPDARLAVRLGTSCATITDWNAAVENGWFMGESASNDPDDQGDLGAPTGWYIGMVTGRTTDHVTQEVHASSDDADADSRTYLRDRNGGTWSNWRVVLKTQTEMDARFAQKEGSASQAFSTAALTVTGALTGTSASLSTTLGVTGAATFEDTVAIAGALTRDGNVVRDAGNTPDCTAATITASDGTSAQQRTVSEAALKAAAEKWAATDTAAGTIRAWVNFSGMITVIVKNRGNVASVVRNGAGDYTVNFTTALAASTFAVTGTCWQDTNDFMVSVIPIARTTTSVRVLTKTTNHAAVDCDDVSVAVIL